MGADKNPCVYIVASKRNGTLYTGVTGNLPGRIRQHREEIFEGFSKEHGTKSLVWFETHPTLEGAFEREKVIKKFRRLWKVRLIEEMNPTWAVCRDPEGLTSATESVLPMVV